MVNEFIGYGFLDEIEKLAAAPALVNNAMSGLLKPPRQIGFKRLAQPSVGFKQNLTTAKYGVNQPNLEFGIGKTSIGSGSK